MTLMKLTRAFLAVASVVLLSSCLDYEEEMHIHNDLSGDATIKVTLPDVLATKFASVQDEFSDEKIHKRFDTLSGVKLVDYSLNTTGRRPIATAVIKFSSLKKLHEAIQSQEPAALFLGSIEVKQEKGITTIDRKLGTVVPKGDTGDGNMAMYVTHFDSNLAHTNSGFYDGSHDTVRYRFKVDDILSQQPVMSNSLAKGFPWLLILICLAVLGGGSYFGWKMFGTRTVTKPR